MRIAPFITGLGITAVALSGCAGTTTTSEKSVEKTTVTETVSAPATAPGAAPGAAPSTAASASATDLPQPPAGASPQEARTDNGVQFSRYSITGQQPQQVVDYYTGIWQGEGYTITNSGGGGGYGQYGGSGAGATGSKSGSFVAVNAGGQSAGPTYFSVCAGADEEAVRQCSENNANNDNNNGNDNNQNNNGN